MRRNFISLTLTGLLAAAAASAQTAPYVRTAVVSPTPGNELASGTTLINTLAGLTPAPSSTNRWLLKIEPGVYNTGTTSVLMRSWVDIEGSGVLQTTIRGTVGPNLSAPNFDEFTTVKTALAFNQGVVKGADNAEIRQLTIECVSTLEQPSCMGMINDMASPRVTDVRIRATTPPATGGSLGSHWGMRNFLASPILDRVDIRAANAGNADNYGVVNVGDTTKFTVVIRNSEIVAGGTGNKNIGILNRGWAVVNPMVNTNSTASGGSYAYALRHTESYIADSGPYFIENCRLWAHSATLGSVGLEQGDNLQTIHPVIRGSRVIGDTSGISISALGLIEVVNSTVNGSVYAVTGGDVKLGATWVQNGTISANTKACAGVWNNAFTFYPSTCP